MTDNSTLGVYSEVGRLRKVIVHRPDLSLRRLTPSNHDELLFDDVLWVERAQKEHDAFVEVLRNHNVEVFYVHELLGEALDASDKARVQVIEAVANESTVGWSIVDEIRAMLEKLPPALLGEHLIGGLTISELDPDWERLKSVSLLAAANEDPDLFVLPPLPNTLFTRDSSAWIFDGVTVNPMFWPARRSRGAQSAYDLPLPPDVPAWAVAGMVPGQARGGRRHTPSRFVRSRLDGGR